MMTAYNFAWLSSTLNLLQLEIIFFYQLIGANAYTLKFLQLLRVYTITLLEIITMDLWILE